MDTGEIVVSPIFWGIMVVMALVVVFTMGYNYGYAKGVSDILECETDMECEMIVHKVGK